MKLFKSKTISESSLVCCLEDIRSALQQFDLAVTNKIIFLNLESFYAFMTEYEDVQKDNGKNLEELFSIIEPYIPLSISDENISEFLHAAMANNEERLVHLEHCFVQSAKVKFMQSIMNVKTQEEWAELLNVCRTIRSYKAQGIDVHTLSL